MVLAHIWWQCARSRGRLPDLDLPVLIVRRPSRGASSSPPELHRPSRLVFCWRPPVRRLLRLQSTVQLVCAVGVALHGPFPSSAARHGSSSLSLLDAVVAVVVARASPPVAVTSLPSRGVLSRLVLYRSPLVTARLPPHRLSPWQCASCSPIHLSASLHFSAQDLVAVR
ncbi:hypothetical protein GUJ93_ZPchr0012g22132 [Zizania palustris]|uniref:Uncharacterized protein n=1 Tax=Zizania palustris TaxID=103762 RepID=A0A8J5WWN0_ZIZPA|nr:hypothetical protein GUJ93_ZPchr0012g22132 [Zizania palustris]